MGARGADTLPSLGGRRLPSGDAAFEFVMKRLEEAQIEFGIECPVSYTHLDVYKRQV